jgi:hypothetical protein
LIGFFTPLQLDKPKGVSTSLVVMINIKF